MLIITTIDVSMQDLAERALLEELRTHQRQRGCGYRYGGEDGRRQGYSKLTKCADDDISRIKNHAVSDLLGTRSRYSRQPSITGSTDDGVVVHNRLRVETAVRCMANVRSANEGLTTGVAEATGTASKLPQTLMVKFVTSAASSIIDDHYRQHSGEVC